MSFRKISIRALLVIIGVISLVMAIKYKQWEIVKEILSKLIEYENGGLPKAL
ncbi:MAG: hypothetical protein ACTSX9_02025 [Candidatus Njordarchaeales archaeon]